MKLPCLSIKSNCRYYARVSNIMSTMNTRPLVDPKELSAYVILLSFLISKLYCSKDWHFKSTASSKSLIPTYWLFCSFPTLGIIIFSDILSWFILSEMSRASAVFTATINLSNFVKHWKALKTVNWFSFNFWSIFLKLIFWHI